MKNVEQYWYRSVKAVPLWLRGLSYVFRLLAFIRRLAYALRLRWVSRMPVPVVVVGNITVGGSGKTPVVVWLVEQLKARGYKPGIVSRGYGGEAKQWPQQVRPDADPRTVGDEAVLIARRSQCPMAVGPERVAAARALLKHHDVDIIVSDDGMQHYALGRDIEIAVIDGARRFGNGYCLPAGPLREPVARLQKVDFRINNGGPLQPFEELMTLQMTDAVNLKTGQRRPMREFQGEKVHAIAGIGNPQRFFLALEKADLDVEGKAFPDHHPYAAEDIQFDDTLPVFMTEKDAVKCERFATERHWYVPVQASLAEKAENKLFELIAAKKAQKKR